MKKKQHSRSQSKGFTLLEVMIALIIFGLIATVIQKVTAQTIVQSDRIRLKTFANWIAENKLTEMRLSDQLPAAREQKDDLEYANENWKIVSKVSKTADVNFHRVDLEIYHLDEDNQFDKGNQVLSYSGFVGRY